MLLVVTAVVLWIAARAWKGLGPTALEASGIAPGTRSEAPHARAGARSAGQTTPRALPGLREAREKTDQHGEDVRKALEATR